MPSGVRERRPLSAQNPAARVRAGQNPLLQLPAVRDNAAMQTEPRKPSPPKRRRRRFQFSLRTLMIGVTLLAVPCAYVGWPRCLLNGERSAASSRLGIANLNKA